MIWPLFFYREQSLQYSGKDYHQEFSSEGIVRSNNKKLKTEFPSQKTKREPPHSQPQAGHSWSRPKGKSGLDFASNKPLPGHEHWSCKKFLVKNSPTFTFTYLYKLNTGKLSSVGRARFDSVISYATSHKIHPFVCSNCSRDQERSSY